MAWTNTSSNYHRPRKIVIVLNEGSDSGSASVEMDQYVDSATRNSPGAFDQKLKSQFGLALDATRKDAILDLIYSYAAADNVTITEGDGSEVSESALTNV